MEVQICQPSTFYCTSSCSRVFYLFILTRWHLSPWTGLLSATMSTSTQTPLLSPAVGHVILVVYLFPDTELCNSLYLEVPIHAATTICFICAKYLAFLGFAILNHVGRISKSPGGAFRTHFFYFVVPNKSDAGMSQIYPGPSFTFCRVIKPSSVLSVSNERMDALRLQQSFLLRFRSCIPSVHLLAPRQIFAKRPIFSLVHGEAR